MAENSKIEWTDHTFNPWLGCTKVSPGCDHCYAETRMDTRLHRVTWGAGQPRQRTKTWGDPEKWNKAHEAFYAAHGRRQRVFCASLADVFDNEVPQEWRSDLFQLIAETPNLDWLLLTKRIGNAKRMMDEIAWNPGQPGPCTEWQPMPNVWLGATIVNREELLRDAPKLKAVHARVRFWSVEPMLGDLGEVPPELLPDWVIVGGESGPHARPMHPDWARSLRDQCAAAGVPFLFKQWGEFAPTERTMAEVAASPRKLVPVPTLPDSFFPAALVDRIGKKAAGRLLDGVEHNGFPGAA